MADLHSVSYPFPFHLISAGRTRLKTSMQPKIIAKSSCASPPRCDGPLPGVNIATPGLGPWAPSNILIISTKAMIKIPKQLVAVAIGTCSRACRPCWQRMQASGLVRRGMAWHGMAWRLRLAEPEKGTRGGQSFLQLASAKLHL